MPYCCLHIVRLCASATCDSSLLILIVEALPSIAIIFNLYGLVVVIVMIEIA